MKQKMGKKGWMLLSRPLILYYNGNAIEKTE